MNELEQYALGLLCEETSEAGQMIGKWLRFGPDHKRKSDNSSARLELEKELGDVLAAIHYACEAGLVDRIIVDSFFAEKFEKLVDPNSKDDEGRRLAPVLPGHL